MEKLLILSQTVEDDYSLMEWKKNGYEVGITLKNVPKLIRGFRRIWIKLGLPFQHIWYGTWKKEFLDYDVIILHGTWLAEGIPHWMREQAKKAGKDLRIIWWYWNRVVDLDHPERVSEQDCEKWSFDQMDCKKYGMNYNTQYYFKSFALPENVEVTSDVYFLGSDGGRLPFVQGIEKQLHSLGFQTDFNILVSPQRKEELGASDSFITEKMSYEENLRHIAGSKAVLEILREGQSGQTLRSLECLFHQRKLITNDRSIDGAVYYHPNNIFILEKDDIDDLPAFMEKPFVPIRENIVNIYESKSWLERFGIESRTH